MNSSISFSKMATYRDESSSGKHANDDSSSSSNSGSVASLCSTSASSSASSSSTGNNNNNNNIKSTTKARQPPPERFICPLTLDIMQDPVLSRWGHNFERHAIVEWFTKHENECLCPLTRKPLKSSSIMRNRALQLEIEQWKELNGILTPPSDFICPVSKQLMVHPIMTRYGDNMERESIIQWMQLGHSFCPVRGKPLLPRDILPNRGLEQRILAWKRANEIEDDDDDAKPMPVVQHRNSSNNNNNNNDYNNILSNSSIALTESDYNVPGCYFGSFQPTAAAAGGITATTATATATEISRQQRQARTKTPKTNTSRPSSTVTGKSNSNRRSLRSRFFMKN